MSPAALRWCAEGIGEENQDRQNNLDHEKKKTDEHFSCLIVNTLSLSIYIYVCYYTLDDAKYV